MFPTPAGSAPVNKLRSVRSSDCCSARQVRITDFLNTNDRRLHLVKLTRHTKRIAGLYYGWRMIGIVSALRILGGGLHQYGFTVFFLPVTQELGLTRASTSLAFSLARAEGSLAAPLVGYLVDRYGPKPIMITATLLAGVGYILFAWVDELHDVSDRLSRRDIDLAFTAGFVHAPTIVANNWFIRLARPRDDGGQRRGPGGRRDHHALLAVAGPNLGLAPRRMSRRRPVSGHRSALLSRHQALA